MHSDKPAFKSFFIRCGILLILITLFQVWVYALTFEAWLLNAVMVTLAEFHCWSGRQNLKFWYLGLIVPLVWILAVIVFLIRGTYTLANDWRFLLIVTLSLPLIWSLGHYSARKAEADTAQKTNAPIQNADCQTILPYHNQTYSVDSPPLKPTLTKECFSMSMIGNYFMTDKAMIDKIQNNQLSLADLIYNNDAADEENHLDIDKTWHAIHFTLTGELYNDGDNDALINKLIFANNPVNDEDMGYGPANLLTNEEVKMLADSISAVTEENFRSRFDVQEMLENDIYPVIDGEDEAGFFQYVWSYFTEVQQFFQKAAQKDAWILFYIN